MATTVVRQTVSPPRSGGILWRGTRDDLGGAPFSGKRWNPAFGIIEHRGRRSGRVYTTPVAVRRVDGGFVVALAFGAQVDWNRNLEVAQGARSCGAATDIPSALLSASTPRLRAQPSI